MKSAVLCYTSEPGQIVSEDCDGSDTTIFYVTNREQAFQALANQRFDAVATDLVAPRTTADPKEADFLQAVMNRFPQPARILLFDPSKKKQLATSGGVVHQCLTTPTSPEMLGSAARRARFVSTLLAQPGLKRLLPQLRKLPSVPSVYFRVIRLLDSPNTDLADISKAVAEDFMMSARLLQVVNSAYFALSTSIASPAEAVGILGLSRFKALVLAAHIFSAFEPDKACKFSIDVLWQHSMKVAAYARAIAKYETGDTSLAEVAYTAGLLHDVGKFILAANCPELYNQATESAQSKKISYVSAERELLGTTHAEIAASILGTWGLNSQVIEAIAFHHQPLGAPDQKFSVLTAVHAANALAHLQDTATPRRAIQWDTEYLENLGLEHRLDVWRSEGIGVEPKQEA